MQPDIDISMMHATGQHHVIHPVHMLIQGDVWRMYGVLLAKAVPALSCSLQVYAPRASDSYKAICYKSKVSECSLLMNTESAFAYVHAAQTCPPVGFSLMRSSISSSQHSWFHI